jgi:signal transduction histidine kinase
MTSPELLVANVAGVICTAVVFVLGLFVLYKGPRKPGTYAFFGFSLSITLLYVSHLLGINADTAEAARAAFMFNVVNLFSVAFNIHFVYESLGEKTPRRATFMVAAYVFAIGLAGFFLLNPDTFMNLPVPKLYLPFYYEPGPLYPLLLAYFGAFSGYLLYDIARIYMASEHVVRERAKYVLLGLGYGYAIGSTSFLLDYDVPVDPIFGMFLGLYAIPFAYAFLGYELMDVKIIAKRALQYSAGVVAVSLVLILVNAASGAITREYPGFPFWLIPLLSGCATIAVGAFVWKKIREVDALKYEFVSVISHTFRTPLTYIGWSLKELQTATTSNEDKAAAIESIRASHERLIELTESLVGLEATERIDYAYTFTLEDVGGMAREVALSIKDRMDKKRMTLSLNLPVGPTPAYVDARRLRFALQILVENAVSYANEGGVAALSLVKKDKKYELVVSNTGIGIAKDDLPMIFSKFFRGDKARHANTEGLGIGLYLARTIMKRQGGDIVARSRGEGQGAEFIVTLPAANVAAKA